MAQSSTPLPPPPLSSTHIGKAQYDEVEKTLREIFNEIDGNGDGRLDPKELQKALKRLGFPSTKKQAKKIMFISDKDASGTIDFVEFEAFVKHNIKELFDVFDEIDSNGDGYLDSDEVKMSITKIYESELPPQAEQAFIEKFDKSHDGLVSRAEWIQGLILLPLDVHNDTMDNMKQVFDFWRTSRIYLDFGNDSIDVPQQPKPQKDPYGNWLKLLIAGGIAGAVSRTATAPLDRLKTLLQLQSSGESGIFKVFNKIYTEQGVYSLWRGNGANIVKIVPESSCKFLAFEHYKQLISPNGEVTPTQRFFAGALAGATAQTLIYPLEVVKTRLASSAPGTKGYGSIMETVATTVHLSGPTALYKGLIPSLLGILPYAGIDLAVYETLKTEYVAYVRKQSGDSKQHVEIGTLMPLACGMISSSVAQLVSYPLNLVRTRLQAQGMKVKKSALPAAGAAAIPVATVSTGPVEYTGMVDVFTKVVRNEGWRGLYKGIGPNYLKVLPAVSISYAVFENIKRYLE